MCDKPLQTWPSEQLEVLEKCPACGSYNKRTLESELIDWLPDSPTGLWKMMSCTDCGIAYLSPRPDRESIKNAYINYYTHTSDKDDLVHNYPRSIKNYVSKKYYSVTGKSGSYLDYVIYAMMRMLFPISLYLDAKSRHIFTVKNMPGKLLDIGCGNGEYLRFASRFGWNVVGVDFDGSAVSEARSGGLDVRLGSIDVIDRKEKFDFITLSHVVEHVYDPAELIRTCYSLLNDGGTLWLETPNIESMGYALYKSNWRGLEPPRHVMLFNQASLSEILLKSGFVSVKQKLHGLSGAYMGLSSERLLDKSSPCGSVTGCFVRKIAKLLRVTFLELSQLFCKRRREFLTLVAIR